MSLSEPPSGFPFTPLQASNLPAMFWRFNRVDNKQSCVFFGKSGSNRYDDPKKKYGVMYVADKLVTAAVETVLRSSMHGGTAMYDGEYRLIPESWLKTHDVWNVRTSGDLSLADLVDGLLHLNLDAAISTMPLSELPQRWSRWIHHHRKHTFDGIWAISRHYPSGRTVALFNRARTKIVSEHNHGPAYEYEPLWDAMEAAKIRPVP